MSDFEDTGEISPPRPLPEILGPVSREERGRLFEVFAEQVARENYWFDEHPSKEELMEAMERQEFPLEVFGQHWIDKERLLLVGEGDVTQYNETVRSYYSFEPRGNSVEQQC